MRIALIGGTRFIGHHTASLAVERGHQVWALHRGQHPCQVAGARDVLVDRDDPSALCEALRQISPDALADSSALTLKIFHTPAVVLSSVDVYAQFGRLNGLPAPPPEAEVTERSPLTLPYPFRELGGHECGPDYDKKDVENTLEDAVARGAPSVAVLRLPGVLGPRDPRRRFGPIVDALDAGCRELPCEGGARWRLTHAHVRDVAHAILLAADRQLDGYRVYNVGEASTPTMRERVEQLAAAAGASIRWAEGAGPLPAELSLLGLAANDLVLSSQRLRDELGFGEITTPEERAQGVVDWARETRPRGRRSLTGSRRTASWRSSRPGWAGRGPSRGAGWGRRGT